MSEPNTSAWPFPELPKTDDLDISAIFGGGGAPADDSTASSLQETKCLRWMAFGSHAIRTEISCFRVRL